jgi:hypothetical protein
LVHICSLVDEKFYELHMSPPHSTVQWRAIRSAFDVDVHPVLQLLLNDLIKSTRMMSIRLTPKERKQRQESRGKRDRGKSSRSVG